MNTQHMKIDNRNHIPSTVDYIARAIGMSYKGSYLKQSNIDAIFILMFTTIRLAKTKRFKKAA